MAEAKVVEQTGGKSKKTFLIMLVVAVVILLLVLALGVMAFLLLRSPVPMDGVEQVAAQAEADSHERKAKKKKPVSPDAPPVYEKLQTITANLTSEQEDAVIQTDIVLEVADVETQNQLKNILPKVQAETIKLIRGKAPAELRTVAGTDKLAAEIRDMVNELLDARGRYEGVLSVNFTTFIMQ